MMGSRRELVEATAFLAKHRIVPYVSQVLNGLENAEEGFSSMAAGSQIGKIVIDLGAKQASADAQDRSRL